MADARVEVKVDHTEPAVWSANPKPIISTWLANDEDAAVTDAEGRWQIANAPARQADPDHTFRIRVTHADFAGDREWGELQSKQGITTAQLREGTAR